MSNGPPSRDRRSLQDLAKLASSPSLAPHSTRTPPPPPVAVTAEGHDSGIVDLKSMAKNDAGAAERAKTTPLASAPLFEDETPSIAPPPLSVPPVSAKVPSQSPRAPLATSPALSAQAALAAPQKSGSGGMLMPVLVGLALAGLAAIGYIVTRPAKSDAPKSDPVALAPVTTAAAPAASAAPPAPPASAGAGALPPAAPDLHVANDTPTDPAMLPAAGGGDQARGGRRSAGGGGGGTAKKGAPEATGGSSVSGLSAMMAQATNSPSTAPVAPTTPQPAAPAGALGDAVQHAVGGGGAPAATAEPAAPSGPQFAPGSVPEKPSQGAVTSALSRALPDARNCLSSDDPVSKANVTFSSAGSVTAVVVTGSAAGKPAEGCIKTALMKASVPPFAQSSYSANVTVRPN